MMHRRPATAASNPSMLRMAMLFFATALNSCGSAGTTAAAAKYADCGLTLQGDYSVRIRHKQTTSNSGGRRQQNFSSSPESFSHEHAATLIARFTAVSCSPSDEGTLYSLKLFNFSHTLAKSAGDDNNPGLMEALDVPACIAEAIGAHVEATFVQRPSGAYLKGSLRVTGADKLRQLCITDCEVKNRTSTCSDSNVLSVFSQIASQVDTR